MHNMCLRRRLDRACYCILSNERGLNANCHCVIKITDADCNKYQWFYAHKPIKTALLYQTLGYMHTNFCFDKTVEIQFETAVKYR
jgi:hypothetical protein